MRRLVPLLGAVLALALSGTAGADTFTLTGANAGSITGLVASFSAIEALDGAGLHTERPPEGWLYKAWHDNGTLVDLIFAPSGGR